MTGLWLVSYIALWVLVAIIVVLLIGVLRHIGLLYQYTIGHWSGPPTNLRAGRQLPDLMLRTLDGSEVRLSQFAGAPANFAVISPHCSGCLKLMEDIVKTAHEGDIAERWVLVSLADAESTREMVSTLNIPPSYAVLIDQANVVKSEWGIRATPVTVVVDDRLTVVRQGVWVGPAQHPVDDNGGKDGTEERLTTV